MLLIPRGNIVCLINIIFQKLIKKSQCLSFIVILCYYGNMPIKRHQTLLMKIIVSINVYYLINSLLPICKTNVMKYYGDRRKMLLI